VAPGGLAGVAALGAVWLAAAAPPIWLLGLDPGVRSRIRASLLPQAVGDEATA
jgi:hypothetical protein